MEFCMVAKEYNFCSVKERTANLSTVKEILQLYSKCAKQTGKIFDQKDIIGF